MMSIRVRKHVARAPLPALLLPLLPALLMLGCTPTAQTGPGVDTPSTARAVLAIVATPRTIPAPQIADYVAALDSSMSVGARGMLLAYAWSTLEPDSASLNVQRVIDDTRYARSRGLVVLLSIQTINTVKRELPADIASLPWTDARLQRRFDRLLDALAPILGEVTYVSVGNEIGGYLGTRSEWPAYTSFVARSVEAIHRRAPLVRVGATIEYDAAASQTAFTRALIAVSDVAIFTHYPFSSGSFAVAPPTITSVTFDNMLALAGTKPVVLQELGYPASPLNASSDAQQAAFFTDALAQWRQRADRMPFISLFQLHDFTAQQCAELGRYYNLPGQQTFISFLCSLGLRRADGSPRPSWEAVRTATAWLRTP